MNAPSDPDFSSPKMFSSEGRIGRVRWIARCGTSFALLLAVYGAMSFATGRFLPKWQMGFLALVPTIAFAWYFTLSTIQRSHDFGRSGWFSLLAWLAIFVPTISTLVLLFFFGPTVLQAHWMIGIHALPWLCLLVWALVPGPREANVYGRPPMKDSAGTVVLASILMVSLLMALAMMAVGYWGQRATDSHSKKHLVFPKQQSDLEPLRRTPK